MVLAAATLWACGTQSGSQFPSSGDLQKLADQPAAERPRRDTQMEVETWDLTGPLPDEVSDQPAAPQGPWGDLANQLVQARPGLVLASASAQCLARELAHFYLAKRGFPTDSLRRFMAGRCGLTGTPEIYSGYRALEGAGQPETDLAAKWSPEMKDRLQTALRKGAGPQLVGLWFEKGEGMAVLSYVVTPRQVRIDPLPMVPTDGQVVVTGEVLNRADRIEAIINRGTYGFGFCERDSAIPMPRFSLRCEARRTDGQAMIQLASFLPGRVLGNTVAMLLVWPRGETGKHYVRSTLVTDAGTGASPDVRNELAALIGQVRAKAGLKPLRYSDPQSLTAEKLAPHYFAALAGLESEMVAEQVILGLRAGWEVGAPLRVGQFTSGAMEGKVSTARLISDVLEYPGGREALLDPGMDHLAVGVVGSAAAGFLGALFSTYATFELGDAAKNVEKVRSRLDSLRAKRGKAASQDLPALDGLLANVVGEVSEGKLTVEKGLDEAMATAVGRTNHSAHGYSVDADNLDEIAIADALLSAPLLEVAIAVGRYQRKGEPWQRYLVFFVTLDRPTTVALGQAGIR